MSIERQKILPRATAIAGLVWCALLAMMCNLPNGASAQAPPTEVAKLLAGDGTMSDEFGRAVALSGDTAIIGAMGDDDVGDTSGSAYVFVRAGSTWVFQQKLTASGGAPDDRFGTSVAIEGDLALIGATGYDDPTGGCTLACADVGAAYVFVRNAGVWTEQQRLTGSGALGRDAFGTSVSLSGGEALIGAAKGTTPVLVGSGTTDGGAAYHFVQSGGVWSEQAKLFADDRVRFGQFGASVSLSGTTALIGATGLDTQSACNFCGAAYVFEKSGGTWSQQSRLTASGRKAGDFFGASVSLEGDTAMIGARHYGVTNDTGATFVHVRNGGLWSLQQQLTASDGDAEDWFGRSVSFASVAPTAGGVNGIALVGAPRDADNGTGSGSAYLFVRLTSNGFWIEFDKLTASDGAAGDTFGEAVSVSGLAGLVGAWGESSSGFGTGAVYVFESDTDGDGYADSADNCPDIANPSQADADGDGTGDACEPDTDGDGVIDDDDNCPAVTNPGQEDLDNDLDGNACDVCPADELNDVDSDGLCSNDDNCPDDPNSDQANGDGDAAGDVCDPCPLDAANDSDGDGVCGDVDICPCCDDNVDTDGDGAPDGCDICAGGDDSVDSDADTMPDFCDICPLDALNDADGDGVCGNDDVCDGGNDSLDADGDSVPDDCDLCPFDADNDADLDTLCGDVDACPIDPDNDADNDGVCGDVDICPGGDDNTDTDGDTAPDFCDVCPDDTENDNDGDGICEVDDNCDAHANSDQLDTDGDGVGDACEPDTDGDGVADDTDNCLYDSNPDQLDSDGDGIGDACDAATDSDGDGVGDQDDACLGTPAGEPVLSNGCSVDQAVPCGNAWKNHGAYVKAVVRVAQQMVDDGTITEEEKGAIVSARASSSCGQKNN